MAFVVVACVALVVLQIFHMVHYREETLVTARRETTNLARSLMQHAELTFRITEVLLNALATRLEARAPGSGLGPRFMDFLAQEAERSSLFVSFAAVDADGRMIANTTTNHPIIDFSDRDYFTFHKNNAGSAMRIGDPIKGRATAGWLIPVTRRVNAPDGSFRGVAIAAINPAYFQDFYDGMEIGKSGAILLASSSARLLVRRPFVEANIGRDMADSNVFRLIKSAPSGSSDYIAATDGAWRLNSHQVGQTYPIVISVGVHMDEVLAHWRRDTLRNVAETAVIIAILAGLGIMVGRSTGRLASEAEKLRDSNARFDVAMNTMSQGVCLYDRDKRIVIANRNYAEIYHLSPGDVRPGTRLEDVLRLRREKGIGFLTPDDYFADAEVADSTEAHNLSDGRVISLTRHAMQDGGWLTIHDDITARADAERQSAYLARHDQLTGLSNRYKFSTALDEACSRRRRAGDQVAIFMLDLDRFKVVNDTLGHAAGDHLLSMAARKLESCTRDTDIVARLGGDEFAIIQPIQDDAHAAVAALASRIIAAMAEPFNIDGRPVSIGVSIGVALLPRDGSDPRELLRKADVALYAAKAAGRNGFRIFEDDMDVAVFTNDPPSVATRDRETR